MYPETTHSSWVPLAPRSLWIVGSATFTTVTSIKSIIAAPIITTATSQRRGYAVGAATPEEAVRGAEASDCVGRLIASLDRGGVARLCVLEEPLRIGGDPNLAPTFPPRAGEVRATTGKQA